MSIEAIYSVCADCIAFEANGADDSMSAERVQELAAATGGVMIAPVSDSDTGEILEPHFGRSSCDVCGDHLGGYRYHCHVEQR